MKRLLLTLILSACALSAQANSGRKWVVEVDTTETVYAIGDPHADYNRLVGVLKAAKLVDAQAKWIGGKSVVVLTGDTIDKGPEEVKTISFISSLQQEAGAAGGRIILTLGNHEAEFLSAPNGKKTKDFADALRTAGLDPAGVAACKGALGQFLCGLPIAARVNDWFFSHGGYTAGRTISQINADVAQGYSMSGYASAQFIGDDSILEARLGAAGPGGMPWFMGGDAKNDPAKILADYAAKLGVHHIVEGHQPGKVEFPDGISRAPQDLFQRYGLLFLTDGGMSSGIEGSTGTGGAIRITKTQAKAVCANGTEKILWEAGKTIDTAAIHCGK